ncbi:type VII secretion protein EccCb [Actinoallomurus sp. NPDC050550]|uniref:type VII secretion protein EccCb n=1 Tax=Actinoallomurus sp. NPDC050550 TaxID=3154937 RepID=UPI0033D3197C
MDVGAQDTRAVWLGEDRAERSAGLGTDAADVLLAPYHPDPGLYGTVSAGSRLTALRKAVTADHSGPWPSPLAEAPAIDHLLPPLVPTGDRGLTVADPPEGGPLTVPVGIVDRPFERFHGVLRLDLSGEQGHVAIVGRAGSGKSTLATTLVVALALTHTPREVQFYCLDSSGALGALSGLPHVGAVTDQLDPEGATRAIDEVTALLAHRERLFRDRGIKGMADYRRRRAGGEFADEQYGDVFLVVDEAATLRREFSEHAAAFDDLSVHGLDHGIHLIATAGRWSELPVSLRDRVGTRLELRLDDPTESMVDPKEAATVPRRPGHGLTPGEGLPFFAALPSVSGVNGSRRLTDVVAELATTVAEHWAGRPGAPRIRLLPARVPVRSLPEPEDDLTVPLGFVDADLTPIAHDFATSPHLTVFGDAGSGKTNLLRLIIQSITMRHSPSTARIVIADRSGELVGAVPEEHLLGYAFSSAVLGELIDGCARAISERVPGPEIAPARLRSCDWWHGPRLFVLVDDYDQVCTPQETPVEPMLEYLAMGYEVGAHLIVARSSASARTAMTEPLIRGLQDAGGSTLLLSCPPSHGRVFNDIGPRVLPPGRGRYRTRSRTALIQTALAEDLDHGQSTDIR